jgi:hypothetical protein
MKTKTKTKMKQKKQNRKRKVVKPAGNRPKPMEKKVTKKPSAWNIYGLTRLENS